MDIYFGKSQFVFSKICPLAILVKIRYDMYSIFCER